MKRKSGSGCSPLLGHTVWALAVMLAVSVGFGGSAWGAEKWFGIHGGPSIPSLRGGGGNPNSEGFSSRFGPYFGAFGEYCLNDNFAIRVEANYSSEGGQRNGLQPFPDPALSEQLGTAVFANYKNEAILDYIEVPFMAKYSLGGLTRFFVDAGPYVGYLVRAKTVTSGVSALFDQSGNLLATPPEFPPNFDFDADTDIKDDVNKWNFGAAGGLGIETPFGPGKVVLDAHFSYGLTNIQKNTAENGSNNTGAVAFTLGYTYPLK